MKDSTIRSSKTRVIKEIKDASKEQREVTQSLKKYSKPTGPLLLGELDAMVQSYIKAVSSHGTLANSSLSVASGKALIQKCRDAVGNIDIDSSSWTKSLFKRMGYVRRMKTSSKVKVPDGARHEIKFLFHYEIVTRIKERNIPGPMIININQTPLKYVPTSIFTLAEKGATSVTMEGGSDKRCITGTFSITFSNEFLPIYLIYGEKAVQSLRRFRLIQEFSLSGNPTHFYNLSESIKLFQKVIIPCLQKEQKKLNLSPIHKGLIITDVFNGQMMPEVLTILNDNNICLVNIPPNITKNYQPLDLRYLKRYLKNKFSTCYRNQIPKQLDEGVNIDTVDV